MTSKLANHFHSRRLALGLSLGELARRIGYRNINRGARRIQQLERDGFGNRAFLSRVADALGIDDDTVQSLVQHDREQRWAEWEAWVSVPTPITVVTRMMPAVYVRLPLPDDSQTEENAITFAQEHARQFHRQVVVNLSRRWSVYIDESGRIRARVEATPARSAAPYMRIGNKRFVLDFQGPRTAPFVVESSH